jgi:hypothetical protein
LLLGPSCCAAMPFRPVPLTAEGTPLYLDAETTLLADGSAVLHHAGVKEDGKVYLTNHRLLWVSAAAKALALTLRHVREVEKVSKGTFKKTHYVVFTGHAGVDAGSPEETATLTLPSATVRDMWHKTAQLAVVKAVRAFQESASTTTSAGGGSSGGGEAQPQQQAPRRNVSANLIGVAGRRNARQSVMEEQQQVTASAFESIQNLKLRAREVVAMIEEFARNPSNTAVGASAAAAGGDGGGGEGDDETKQQFQSLLQTVGIANPVLRGAYTGKGASALKAFEQEVSLELARFVREPLEVAGGILLLTDL